MSDLSQITLLPVQQQVQGPSQASQGTTSQANTILGSIPTGTTIQGFVINRDTSGNPIIRTDKGDIPFSSSFFLNIGSEVVLRVGNSGGNVLAHLLSVDGQPPEVAQNASAFSHDADVIVSPHLSPALTTSAQSTTATAGATTTQPSITLSGTIVSQPPVSENTAPPLPNGTQLSLKVLSLNTPAAPPASGTLPAEPNAPANSSFYATYARAAGSLAPPTVASTPATETPTPVTTALPAPTTTITTEAAAPPAQPATVTTTVTTSQTFTIPAPTATAAPVIPTQTPAVTVAQALPSTTPQAAAPASAQAPAALLTATSIPVVNTVTVPAAQTVNTTTVIPVAPPTAPVVSTAIAGAPATQAPVTPTASPSSLIGSTLSATVIGKDPSGEQLLQSPIGGIKFQISTVIPTGSQMDLEVLDTIPPSAQAIAAALASDSKPAPLTELAQQWTSLQQIFSLLSGHSTSTGLDDLLQSNAATTANVSNAVTSGVTAQSISSGLLVFISALRRGDFNNWLGDSNIRQLQTQGHGDLVKKAQGEFSGLSRQFTQSPPEDSQNDKNKEEDTRFVIEVDLTQLGEVQMDGFVRKHEKDLQFDMIIRSLNGLSKEVQDDILNIYNNMGAITGYKGSLSFQSVREFPVNPMEDIAKGGDAVIA